MIFKRLLPQVDRDGAIIISATTVRSLGYGFFAGFLGIYLSVLDFSIVQAGFVFSSLMAGGALSNVVASWRGDTIGRRKMLIAMAILMTLGGVLFTLTSSLLAFILVGIIAMSTASGGDRTAFLSLDTAILAQSTAPQDRTHVFVWYNIFGVIAKSVGALLIAMPPLLQVVFGWSELSSFKAMLFVYAFTASIGIVLYAMLSPKAELIETKRPSTPRASANARGMIIRMTAISSIDAFGGGLMTRAFMSFWFVTKFGASPGTIAMIFFAGQILNAISVSLATPIAKRIGILNTMVFTQAISNAVIIGMAFSGNLWMAISFLMMREVTNDMDIPTRQAYTMAIVPPDSRTAMASMSNLGRTVAQTVSPSVAGVVAQVAFMGAPFLAGSGIKLVYNALLFFQFKDVQLLEESSELRKTDQPKVQGAGDDG